MYEVASNIFATTQHPQAYLLHTEDINIFIQQHSNFKYISIYTAASNTFASTQQLQIYLLEQSSFKYISLNTAASNISSTETSSIFSSTQQHQIASLIHVMYMIYIDELYLSTQVNICSITNDETSQHRTLQFGNLQYRTANSGLDLIYIRRKASSQ